MSTFICTVCQNRIKERGSKVDCGYYNDTRPMIEDTTKLYDNYMIRVFSVLILFMSGIRTWIHVSQRRSIRVGMMRCVQLRLYLSIAQRFFAHINAVYVNLGT